VSEEKPVNYFEFRDVCKSFDERLVLDHVSFTVKRGETCVIMGRSGVGKSVSLKHIMGFLKADSGRIFIDGQDVTEFKEADFAEVRRKVTMVFQSGALFDSLTVGENMTFPLEGQPGMTDEDVKGLIAFYGTPLGQKTINILPKVMGEAQDVGRKWGEGLGRAAMMEVMIENPDLAKAAEAAREPAFPK